MTTDRAIHLAVGIVLLALFVARKRRSLDTGDYVLLILFCGLGTWVPDWDLVLGIGFHRSPLTHGLFPWLLLYLVVRQFKLPITISIGFAVGLASHLLWDIIFYGNVRWISGGNYDRLYLFANALILLYVAHVQLLRVHRR